MDPYKILGVATTATPDQIKKAYRDLAKKFHPDLNPGKKEMEAKFKEINDAYEKIGTPEAKAKFDRGETEPQGFGGGGPGGPFYHQTQRPGGRYSMNNEGFDPDFFADLFGQMGGGGSARSRPREQHYSLEVDFRTGVLGGEREINLPTGKKLRVKIPAGIKPGSKLRLAGADGDVLIEINVQASSLFRRNGNDLEVDLPLSLGEAVLGTETPVTTVDGTVMLKVPKGLSSGSKIRVKGKGVPFKDGRGDQIAVVKIVMPNAPDEQLENFMKEWTKTHPHNPRERTEK